MPSGRVDDDVMHRLVEPRAGATDEIAREPVGAALRVRGDDDLVRAERPERVVDREERVRVSDSARGLDPAGAKIREAALEPRRRDAAGAVLVRRPVSQSAVQRAGSRWR